VQLNMLHRAGELVDNPQCGQPGGLFTTLRFLMEVVIEFQPLDHRKAVDNRPGPESLACG
jgi:hypothetical protein